MFEEIFHYTIVLLFVFLLGYYFPFRVRIGVGQVMVLVNFQCRGVQQIWAIVEQGPSVLAVGVDGVVWTFFSPYHLSFLSPSLSGRQLYRLKYFLKELLNPKQSTNQQFILLGRVWNLVVQVSDQCRFKLQYLLAIK